MSTQSLYISTYQKGLMRDKIKKAEKMLASCTLCPRECRVNRLSGETGICKTAKNAWISSYNAHFGEEEPLVGDHGSGTVFFTHCNLLCNFCQNYDISHEGLGHEVTPEQLATVMMQLQSQGCHNINFVTPSHVVPQILAAVEIAIGRGLQIPLVYNSSGYDKVETLKLLDGVIDIYMPDFKFWDPNVSEATCKAPDYPEVARKAITEMHRQVGDLVMEPDGLASRGLLVRHLVLPSGLAGTGDVMRFIAKEISSNTYVNVMPQYRPCGRASEIEPMAVRLSPNEYETAVESAVTAGIKRLDSRRRVFVLEK